MNDTCIDWDRKSNGENKTLTNHTQNKKREQKDEHAAQNGHMRKSIFYMRKQTTRNTQHKTHCFAATAANKNYKQTRTSLYIHILSWEGKDKRKGVKKINMKAQRSKLF